MAEMRDVQARLAAVETKIFGAVTTTTAALIPSTTTPPTPKPARLQITNSPPTPQSSPFFRLSTELRFEIYRLVMPSTLEIDIDSNGYARPALIDTCKEIYLEALPTFYADRQFFVRTQSFDSAVVSRWHQETKHLRRAPRVIACTIWIPHWDNLVTWLKGFHSSNITERSYGSDLSRVQQYQQEAVHSLFRMASTLRRHPWELMERILKDARPTLIALDSRWGYDS